MKSLDDTFWRFVDKGSNPEDCWMWIGRVDVTGYASIAFNAKRKVRVHRFSWQLANGPILPDEVLHHVCGVKLCVNPDHLNKMSLSEHSQLHRVR